MLLGQRSEISSKERRGEREKNQIERTNLASFLKKIIIEISLSMGLGISFPLFYHENSCCFQTKKNQNINNPVEQRELRSSLLHDIFEL